VRQSKARTDSTIRMPHHEPSARDDSPAPRLLYLDEVAVGPGRELRATVVVEGPVVFAPHVRLAVSASDGVERGYDSRTQIVIGWLPRGTYEFEFELPADVPSGGAVASASLGHTHALREETCDRRRIEFAPNGECRSEAGHWRIRSLASAPQLESLSWGKGHADWFFRHFDHAATTVISYLLGDSPLLAGRILDVGCGDGITDLGIALRTGCRQLVGVDPFGQYENLPRIIAGNGLPPDAIPRSLTFSRDDANFLPFDDDSFDVVISWGSVEHIAGGYLQALREIKRVLVPDGLFMVAPGLYYSSSGHHLDEFSSEPFFHLKKSPDEVRRIVLDTPPRYIDRSGHFARNDEYWQWHCELNRITVAAFEKELRALEFEPWRVAIRAMPLVEYTPELQQYSFEQLANSELYVSCVNRKKRRPAQ
jgi:SAM-dependent methyltransferase